ncbi:MAG TPA: hypothetical protein VG168_13975 [Bryobacteraceae bacterium]|nr:hypothetical protein [Bryobacteraceae bacterium]
MTTSELAKEVFALVEAKFLSRTTLVEFELAYQARVAMDRIRFAIKHTEQFAPRTEQMQEAGMQLLDALQRLETAERGFQEQSRRTQNFQSAGDFDQHDTKRVSLELPNGTRPCVAKAKNERSNV